MNETTSKFFGFHPVSLFVTEEYIISNQNHYRSQNANVIRRVSVFLCSKYHQNDGLITRKKYQISVWNYLSMKFKNTIVVFTIFLTLSQLILRRKSLIDFSVH